MSLYYILNENNITKEVERQEYFEWNVKYGAPGSGEKDRKRIGRDKIDVKDCEVSTVFLGIDHSFDSDSEPILFETLVFGGDLDGEMQRYSTWKEAVKGHAEMVEKCGGKVKPKVEIKEDRIESRFDILDL